MGTEVQGYATSSLDERHRYAMAIAEAGDLVPAGLRDGRNVNPGKVMLIMEHATMLGLHPIVGVNNINIIDGKVSIPPALMSALVRGKGHKLRVTTEGTIEDGDFKAIATLVRLDDDNHPFVASWTPHRAQRAGLCSYAINDSTKLWVVRALSNGGKPMPWQSYTEALCKARAISEVCMEGATDVMMGSVYTPEELGANVDGNGVVIEAQSVDVQQSQRETGESREQAAPATANTSAPVQSATDAVSDSRDWAADVALIASSAEARTLYAEARDAGVLDLPVDYNDQIKAVHEHITDQGLALLEAEKSATNSESNGEEIVDAEIVEDDEPQTLDDSTQGGE